MKKFRIVIIFVLAVAMIGLSACEFGGLFNPTEVPPASDGSDSQGYERPVTLPETIPPEYEQAVTLPETIPPQYEQAVTLPETIPPEYEQAVTLPETI